MYSLEDIKRYMVVYSPKGFLIDTCILILLLVGQYDSRFIEKSKLLGNYSVQDFDLLKNILFLFQGRDLFITTQVITELSNLSIKDGGMYGSGLSGYWLVLLIF